MMLMALLRSEAGHVSLTSTAPDAHSPPMPMPSTARQSSSCSTLCEVDAPSDAREKQELEQPRGGGRAERREREDQDRAHQRAGAPETIRHVAEDQSTDP